MTDRWEYHIENWRISRDRLAALGRDGWELVLMTGYPAYAELIFKRRLPAASVEGGAA